MALRVLYSDVDGTLVGPGGCFFTAEDGSRTLEPARALVDLLDAGVALVLVSGRTRPQLLDLALVLGADGFVAELGAVVCWSHGRQVHHLTGAGPPADPALLDRFLAAFAGRLELHDPWHLGHEVDVLLRGRIDPAEGHDWLAEHGAAHLRLRDNGVLPVHRPTGLAAADGPVHVYHLLADGISKGAAVAIDLARRGVDPADAAAVGDSRSDLEMAAHVGRFFLVANGARHGGRPGPAVTVTRGALGAGWAQAVHALLADG